MRRSGTRRTETRLITPLINTADATTISPPGVNPPNLIGWTPTEDGVDFKRLGGPGAYMMVSSNIARNKVVKRLCTVDRLPQRSPETGQ